VFELHAQGWSLVVALSCAVLLSLLLINARRNLLALPVLSRLSSPRPADCMVVIPARDEEDVIARAVRSLPPDSVIVVDDGSSDRTARVAREAGAGVLSAGPLPRGGNPKSNACAAGAATLTSKWILFADADTWFEQGFIDAAVAACEQNGASFLSVYPQIEPHGALEHMLEPYLAALYFAGTNPKSIPAGAFCGHVVLARRETYEFLGGHRALLRESVDDVRMARLAERHRVAYALARAPRLAHVRMYKGVTGIWSGLERQAIRLQMASPLRAVSPLLTALAGVAWGPVLVWLVLEQNLVAAAGLALLPIALLWPWYRGPRAILGPFAFYLVLPFLLRAMLTGLTGRAVLWKGRKV
jgi:4,4'-diaponeurosporenoate glycosyltransferase